MPGMATMSRSHWMRRMPRMSWCPGCQGCPDELCHEPRIQGYTGSRSALKRGLMSNGCSSAQRGGGHVKRPLGLQGPDVKRRLGLTPEVKAATKAEATSEAEAGAKAVAAKAEATAEAKAAGKAAAKAEAKTEAEQPRLNWTTLARGDVCS